MTNKLRFDIPLDPRLAVGLLLLFILLFILIILRRNDEGLRIGIIPLRTPTVTFTPTSTLTNTPTATPTNTPTSTPTNTTITIPIDTATSTSMSTATATPTATPSHTLTPTPTPTATATAGVPAIQTDIAATETAQATELATTYNVPTLIFPENNQSYNGQNTEIILSWQDVGLTNPNDQYVIISSRYDGEAILHDYQFTKEATFRIPAYIYPGGTNKNDITWYVQVFRNAFWTEEGGFSGIPVSPPSEVRTFIWKPEGEPKSESGPTPTIPPP